MHFLTLELFSSSLSVCKSVLQVCFRLQIVTKRSSSLPVLTSSVGWLGFFLELPLGFRPNSIAYEFSLHSCRPICVVTTLTDAMSIIIVLTLLLFLLVLVQLLSLPLAGIYLSTMQSIYSLSPHTFMMNLIRDHTGLLIASVSIDSFVNPVIRSFISSSIPTHPSIHHGLFICVFIPLGHFPSSAVTAHL